LVGSLPSPYIPKANSHSAHLGYSRPLSSPARTSSSTASHCPRRRIRLAVPESDSLVPPRTSSSIVLAAFSLNLMRPAAVLLASYPARVIPVRPCSSNKGEVGEVRRSRTNHCLTPPCFIVLFFWSRVDDDRRREATSDMVS
jgi:hypothetical protein